MPHYSCDRCGKEFSQKSHYDSHKRRKKPCENYSNKIQTLVDKKVQETINDLNLNNLINLISNNEDRNNDNMDTFSDLYRFLQKYENGDIIDWLKESWVGKDKQESLLRLFAGLGLIDKLNLYDICHGNYNKKTINKNTYIKDVFYDNTGNLIHLKDKGDSSDLTGIHKEDDKHLLVTTSKNLNKTNVGGLDISQILMNYKKYEVDGFTMSLCICIRSREEYNKMRDRIEGTNNDYKVIIDKEDTIILDWNDLNQAYHQFKMYFGQVPLDNIINSDKTTLCLKMHQHLGVLKTIRMRDNGKKKILWGHIQRSGKSYIIGGCIIKDSADKEKCNYLIITTAPNETIEQQRKVFDCIQLKDFKIITLNGNNKKPVLSNKNIILCSKQFLQTKIDKGHDKQKHSEEKTRLIKWLKDISFDMRFIDESHNGGTTELAQKTLETYGKESFTVQITATYSKPINDYNIPKENWILWDLEDIKLCKNICNDGNINRLVEKHGEDIREIMNKYSPNNIIDEYSKYPELCLLTDEIKSEVLSTIINATQDNNYGWSPDACFLLKQGNRQNEYTGKNEIITQTKFQNESENLKLWYRIFGKKGEFGIPDKDYPEDKVFMERIKNICKNPEIDSRFIGEGEFQNEPMIIMAFLPQNNINKISAATIDLLEKNNVLPDYEIISINSKTTSNPKQSIEDARNRARISGKKGVLVLSGRQCSLGVSIINCDIVILLNNSMGFDMIYQMMFRCMTEGKNKKCGFVIDLNIQRVIDTSIINYASLIKPDIHPKEATKYILQEKLINLNADHWMTSFGNSTTKITGLCEDVYEIYSSDCENALNHYLNRLRFKDVLFNKEDQLFLNTMFSNTTPTKAQRELIDKIIEESNEENQIKIGIDKDSVDNEENSDMSVEISDENEQGETDKKINYMDILRHIIPLICLLTIHNKDTSFIEMFNCIQNDNYIYNILIDQTKSWWGKSIDSNIIKKFINVYIKYMSDDKEINQIILTVKELFMKNINNDKELSNLIDKYLIPHELEMKENAEVSTPFKLRQDMLDKIPVEFWKSEKKVFEPSSGKGGFILDIIDRFMIGLKEVVPDEKNRRKLILEECLYFNDINSTNIFICKLLIDPNNEYKLNYNEGSTLDLDIKEKWNIDAFDAVIGNPPYNKGKNANFYVNFMKYSYDNLIENGLNLFVVPNRFLIPKHRANQCLNLFQVNHIVHTVKDFKVSTDIGYYLATKSNNANNETVCCIFNEGEIQNINLNIPTPTANNSFQYKNLSDKILMKNPKMNFIKEKKENLNGTHLFIPRHWTRYASSKPKGGKHVFNIVDEYGDDGRFILVNESNKENIKWYLSRSKIIRFITNNYASTVFIPPFIWDTIPIIDFENKYNDNELYELFELSEDQIQLIENSVD